jgi:hypothetical protein
MLHYLDFIPPNLKIIDFSDFGVIGSLARTMNNAPNYWLI